MNSIDLSRSETVDAARDALGLLAIAHNHVHRAQRAMRADGYQVASRLSRQLQQVRQLAELLLHEAENHFNDEAPSRRRPLA